MKYCDPKYRRGHTLIISATIVIVIIIFIISAISPFYFRDGRAASVRCNDVAQLISGNAELAVDLGSSYISDLSKCTSLVTEGKTRILFISKPINIIDILPTDYKQYKSLGDTQFTKSRSIRYITIYRPYLEQLKFMDYEASLAREYRVGKGFAAIVYFKSKETIQVIIEYQE